MLRSTGRSEDRTHPLDNRFATYYVKGMNTDPECLIALAYGTENQKFWNGRRWVSDASDAETYTGSKARKAYELVAGKAGHEQIVLIENYGLETERVAMGWAS